MNISQTKCSDIKTITITGDISKGDLMSLKAALRDTKGCRQIRIDLSETENITPEIVDIITGSNREFGLHRIKLANAREFTIEILKGRFR
jgi:hypothetical protein